MARIGGDEFTVIIEGVDGRDDIAAVAEKLVRQVSADQDRFALGVSIGIACLPESGDNVGEIMRAADTAM
ncbi:diguanylate cyclase domain-containing protein [Pseudomonas caspiana]